MPKDEAQTLQKYFRDIYKRSPILRRYLRENYPWYPRDLLVFLDAKDILAKTQQSPAGTGGDTTPHG